MDAFVDFLAVAAAVILGVVLYLGLGSILLQKTGKDQELLRAEKTKAWIRVFLWLFSVGGHLLIFLGEVLFEGIALLVCLLRKKHPYGMNEEKPKDPEYPIVALPPNIENFLNDVTKK